MINALVLAAGESTRMGKAKPLLPFGRTTFLGQVLSVLEDSRVDAVTVVLGAGADAVRESVDLSQANVVVNKDYKKGQLSSLIAALKAAPAETEAVLLCLVDHPFITTELVDSIIDRFRATGSQIIVPVFEGHRGHPTLFAKPLFAELIGAPPDRGAREVLYANEDKVLEVQVSQRKALIGIDTPEDYKRLLGLRPNGYEAQ